MRTRAHAQTIYTPERPRVYEPGTLAASSPPVCNPVRRPDPAPQPDSAVPYVFTPPSPAPRRGETFRSGSKTPPGVYPPARVSCLDFQRLSGALLIS